MSTSQVPSKIGLLSHSSKTVQFVRVQGIISGKGLGNKTLLNKIVILQVFGEEEGSVYGTSMGLRNYLRGTEGLLGLEVTEWETTAAR